MANLSSSHIDLSSCFGGHSFIYLYEFIIQLKLNPAIRPSLIGLPHFETVITFCLSLSSVQYGDWGIESIAIERDVYRPPAMEIIIKKRWSRWSPEKERGETEDKIEIDRSWLGRKKKEKEWRTIFTLNFVIIWNIDAKYWLESLARQTRGSQYRI